jgi:ribosomal protein L3 glutamine methyltransferase
MDRAMDRDRATTLDKATLEKALRAASDTQGWLAALAAYFAAHPLHYGHGTDNAGDEAFWLIRHLQDWDDAAWARPPDPALVPRIVALAAARARERRPLAYLLGEAWFAGLAFEVDEHVLVPRSPLAELIERGFAPWCELAPGDRVLDIGTGSGCLAIAVAHYCAAVRVDATDNSREALALAARNVTRHGLADRVRLIEADLYPRDPDPSDGTRYRVIISNPPYVPDADIAQLPPEYRHEPLAALAGGPDGLDAVARLMEGAAEHLATDGVLIVEVGVAAKAFSAAWPTLPVIWLEFERGGEGVFVVGARDLAAWQKETSGATRRRRSESGVDAETQESD